MSALRSALDELCAGFARDVAAAIANARVSELREIVGGGTRPAAPPERRRATVKASPKKPRRSAKSTPKTTTNTWSKAPATRARRAVRAPMLFGGRGADEEE